jgi:hypothetical protein
MEELMENLFLLPLLLSSLAFAQVNPVQDLKAGEWYEVPNSKLRDVAEPGSHIGNADCIMSCWTGGAFDSQRNRLYVTGGGHQGYSGNELYAFDVDDLKWYRLNDSAPIVPGSECPPETTPCATHTYDGLEYIPTIDRFFEIGWNTHTNIWASEPTWLFDPNNLTWNLKSLVPVPNTYWSQRTGAISAYDSSSDLVWYRPSYTGPLSSFDPKTGAWTEHGYGGFIQYYTTAEIDPVQKKMVAIGGNESFVWDLSNPSAGSIGDAQLIPTGPTYITTANNPGLAFDPVSQTIIGWAGGADVYSLNLSLNSWTQMAAASTNTVTPTAPNGNGTYGRFRYSSKSNVFVLANSVDQNVFLYRLSNQAIQVPAAPSNLMVH